MQRQFRTVLATSCLLLLSACAGSGGRPAAGERLECPADEVVVCRGGTASKLGRPGDRDPRYCGCRPRDQVTL